MGFERVNRFGEDRMCFINCRGVTYSPTGVTEDHERGIYFFEGESDREPPYHVNYYMIIKERWVRIVADNDKKIGNDEWLVKVLSIEPAFDNTIVSAEYKRLAKEALYIHKNCIIPNNKFKYIVGD